MPISLAASTNLWLSSIKIASSAETFSFFKACSNISDEGLIKPISEEIIISSKRSYRPAFFRISLIYEELALERIAINLSQ